MSQPTHPQPTGPNASPGVRQVTTDEEDAGQRIDNFLLRQLKGVPRSRIYSMLRRGEVRVNGGRIKATYRLAPGDQIRLPPVRTATRTTNSGPAAFLGARLADRILYEDEGLIAVDKPSGIAVHGGSGLSFGVIEALRALRPQERSLELVHRLDRDTSGVLLIARRRSALRRLHQLLRDGAVEKYYLALVCGSWPKDKVSVTLPLRKNLLRGGERMVCVEPDGKAARTDFEVVRRRGDIMLVEARLHTGRTHQIRVHAQSLGSPVAGDEKYGDAAMNRRFADAGLRRLFLHARRVVFPWATEADGTTSRLRIESPLGDDLQAVLDRLEIPWAKP